MKRATRTITAINPATKYWIRDANDGASTSMFQSVAKALEKRNMKNKRIKINSGEQVELYLRKPGTKMFYSKVSTSNDLQTEPQTKTAGLKATMTIVGPASISIVKTRKPKASRP